MNQVRPFVEYIVTDLKSKSDECGAIFAVFFFPVPELLCPKLGTV